MKTRRYSRIVCFAMTAWLLVACSDDSRSKATDANNALSSPSAAANAPADSSSAAPRYDHSHGSEVTDLVKHQFEHQFADQCVERELKHSSNPDVDRQRWTQPCLCIAQYLMKDLTAKEAELFLKQNKNTQSLRIRFEAAAYQCLQKQAAKQAKAPTVFNQRPPAP